MNLGSGGTVIEYWQPHIISQEGRMGTYGVGVKSLRDQSRTQWGMGQSLKIKKNWIWRTYSFHVHRWLHFDVKLKVSTKLKLIFHLSACYMFLMWMGAPPPTWKPYLEWSAINVADMTCMQQRSCTEARRGWKEGSWAQGISSELPPFICRWAAPRREL